MDAEVPSDQLQPVSVRFEADDFDWQVAGLRLVEGLNQPYELELELESDDLSADPADLLGLSVTVSVERDALCRVVHGIVASLEERAPEHDRLKPRVTIVPALMALDQGKTSRIFQEMTVPEILKQVLGDGLQAYGRRVDLANLHGKYAMCEYVVQYRESNFAFAERLMEENGIGYLFTHEGGAEELVLFDTNAVFTDLISFGNQEGFLPVVRQHTQTATREDVREFSRRSRLRPTAARTLVFDWMDPERPYPAERRAATDLGTVNGAETGPEREEYDHDEPITAWGYRSGGLNTSPVDAQMELRRKLHNRDAVRCEGTSTATQLQPGTSFELAEHPQADLDADYFVVSAVHTFGRFAKDAGDAGDAGEATADVTGASYSNRFECLPRAAPWHPERCRPRPRIPSMQTATVVGPVGEEIHTDEHGRIKIKLHWDRREAADDGSSCFVRVLQPWAGSGWGSLFLPRIGMEVAITFIDGDPERPVVTGCVYNGANPPPYSLPGEMTKSTIKSNSSPGGGGSNELRFEDAAGSEEVYLHAQKDFNEVVLNDHNTKVGNDQTNTVHANQTEVVDGNQTMTVGGDREVEVKGGFDETVVGTETRYVIGDVTETFAANEARSIGANQDETVAGNVTRTITGKAEDTITGTLTQTVTGGVSITTPATYEVTATAGITMNAPAGMKVMAPGGFTVLAPGGTRTIDNFFEMLGTESRKLFQSDLSMMGNKLDVTGLSTGFTGVKNEFTGVSLSHTGITGSNTGVDLKTVTKAELVSGLIGLYMLGTLVIG